MNASTFYDLTSRVANSPSDTAIAEGIAAAEAGIVALHHHRIPNIQRGAADAMLLLTIARDSIFSFKIHEPLPGLRRDADDALCGEVIALLQALSRALLQTAKLSPAIEPMTAARASMLLDEASAALRD